MADKKAPAPSNENGHTLSFQIAGIVILFFIVFAAIEKSPFFSPALENIKEYNESENQANSDTQINLPDLKTDLKLGQKIINKGKTIVRRAPGGQIIGTQIGGLDAKIVEGPVVAFSKIWWRLDYKNAPDGWVEDKDISANSWWFKITNFFPNLYANIKNYLILIGIIIFILVFIYSFKSKNILKLRKQKREVSKPTIYQTQKPPEPQIIIQEDVGLPIPNLPVADQSTVNNLKFEVPENKRWKNIEYLISSHNSNDWRQAIIECDVILEEMLDRMGYEGDSVGDKLKQIESSDFLTLNYAWEAHKVRNRIAHSGSAFIMSRDEAQRIVDLYRKVFDEFYYI